MKDYQVEIIITLRRVVTVSANSSKEAEEIIKSGLASKNIVLNISDSIGSEVNELMSV